MADNTISTVIELNADKASAEATKKLVASVKGVVVDLGKGDALKPLAAATAHMQKEFQQTDKRGLELANRFIQIRMEAEELGQTYDDLIRREKQLGGVQVDSAPSVRGVKVDRSDRFDSIDASGDIASATGGLRGGLDALGVSANSTTGRVLELAEAMGDLGEYGPILARTLGDLASKGGPATVAAFGALSGKLGDTGAKALISAGSIGLAGAALALLSVAITKLQKDATDAQKGLSEAFAAQDKTNAFRDSGATEAAARERAAGIERELATARKAEADARAIRDQAFKEVQAANGDAKARFGVATGYFSEFDKRIEETSKRVASLSADYNDLNGALKAGEFKKDADTLAAAVSTTSIAYEDAAAKQKQAALSAAAVQAQAAEEAATAQKEAAREAAENAKKALEAQAKYSQGITKVNTDTRNALADARRDARNDAARQGRAYQDDLIALTVKAQEADSRAMLEGFRDERDARIKQYQTLEDLGAKFRRDEKRSLAERNFLNAALAGEGLKEGLEDAQTAAQREAQARALAFADADQDRDIQLESERNQRRAAADIQIREMSISLSEELAVIQTGKGRQLEALQQSYSAELQQLEGYLGARSQMMAVAYQPRDMELRSSSGNTNNSYGGNTSITDNRSMNLSLQGGGPELINQARHLWLRDMQAARYR